MHIAGIHAFESVSKPVMRNSYLQNDSPRLQSNNAPCSDHECVPSIQVLKLMQSFKSQEFVTERYSWRYYYW